MDAKTLRVGGRARIFEGKDYSQFTMQIKISGNHRPLFLMSAARPAPHYWMLIFTTFEFCPSTVSTTSVSALPRRAKLRATFTWSRPA
jgi:hypothetical protein